MLKLMNTFTKKLNKIKAEEILSYPDFLIRSSLFLSAIPSLVHMDGVVVVIDPNKEDEEQEFTPRIEFYTASNGDEEYQCYMEKFDENDLVIQKKEYCKYEDFFNEILEYSINPKLTVQLNDSYYDRICILEAIGRNIK